MPVRMISAADEAGEALRQELGAARALFDAQRELDAAVTAGAPADRLWPLLRAQEEAAIAASEAARSRSRFFHGVGSAEAFLQGKPAAEANALRALLAEAAQLRREIHRTAHRTTYIAGRTVEWTQAQLDLVIRWVTRQTATYSASGDRPAARPVAFMDRSA